MLERTTMPAGSTRRAGAIHHFRLALLTIVALTLVTASCSKDRNTNVPAVSISASDITFPGMQMRPGGTPSSFTLIGRVKNRSAQATLAEVQLKMTMEDVLASGSATTVAAANVVMRHTVPPGESRNFEEKVEFGALPKPRGRLEWNYAVVEVKGM